MRYTWCMGLVWNLCYMWHPWQASKLALAGRAVLSAQSKPDKNAVRKASLAQVPHVVCAQDWATHCMLHTPAQTFTCCVQCMLAPAQHGTQCMAPALGACCIWPLCQRCPAHLIQHVGLVPHTCHIQCVPQTGPTCYIQCTLAPAPTLCTAHARQILCIACCVQQTHQKHTGSTVVWTIGLCELNLAYGPHL